MKTIYMFPNSPQNSPQTQKGDLLLIKNEQFQQVLVISLTLDHIFTMIEIIIELKWVSF